MNKKTRWFFISLLCLLILSTYIKALPAGPVVSYVSNTSAQLVISNRSEDAKGTITTVNIDLKQQDYKWKAYVGNVTGKLALDDANAKSIYDWSLSTITGEVYASRYPNINWAGMSCATQGVVDNEQTALGMASTIVDNINSTFSYQAHKSFLVGVTNITASTCRSTATYIDGTPQTVDEDAYFQEILLKDSSNSLVYTTLIETDHQSFDNVNTYDFQLLIAENESSTVPTTYFFYVELG